ncbi:MAG TPA: hypothetical protein VGN24_03670 [Rhodanobacter sp.]|jgi:hypothetical protein|nr:hypothetical protein [Rhodanobacter sp.]
MSHPRSSVTQTVPGERLVIATDSVVRLARVFFFVTAISLFLSTLYFILRTANPVMRSDAWYFLDVFVRKVLDGSVTAGDFFVKRFGADHAQPLFKLLLLAELHFYDLDDSLQAIVGLISAAGCALILCKVILADRSGGRSDALRYLAGSAVCALLFSLQSTGVWIWPLVALGYLTTIPVLLFFWSLWTAWQSQRFVWLVAATIVLGVVDDDSAIIVVIAAVLTIIIIALSDPVRRGFSTWKILLTTISITLIVRVAYSFAARVGGEPLLPLTNYLKLLAGHSASDAIRWITIPLTSSLMTPAAPFGANKEMWGALQNIVLMAMFIAQLAFWWRAFKAKCTRTQFFAIGLMLVSYAWVAGILLYRVSDFGTNYLFQERYVQLFGFNVVALLLMAISSRRPLDRAVSFAGRTAGIALAASCLFIVGLQVFYIADAWHQRPYLIHYYQGMGIRLEQLAQKPEDNQNCYPELVICQIPLADRRELIELLVKHQLNVFSPAVRLRHPYLKQGVVTK